MNKTFLVLVLLLTACSTTAVKQDHYSVDQLSTHYSCEDLSLEIDETEKVIADAAPSETEDIVQDTAIDAGVKGIQVSGALGTAGVFAGIGINFFRRLYDSDAKTRREQTIDDALTRQNALIEAYYLKNCDINEDMNTKRSMYDW